MATVDLPRDSKGPWYHVRIKEQALPRRSGRAFGLQMGVQRPAAFTWEGQRWARDAPIGRSAHFEVVVRLGSLPPRGPPPCAAEKPAQKGQVSRDGLPANEGTGRRTLAGLRAQAFTFASELEVLPRKPLAALRILRREEGLVAHTLVLGRRVHGSRVVEMQCAGCGIGYERGACGVAMRGAGGNMIDWAACAARTDHSVAMNSAGSEPSRAGSMRLSSQGESLKRWRSRRSRRRCARRHTCRMWRTHKDATARLGGQSVLYARPARTRTQKSSIADLPGVKTTHSQYSVFCHKRTVRTPRRDSESNRGYRGLFQPILGLVHRSKPSTSPWDSDNVPE